MSIPYIIPIARGRFRAGKIDAAEFNRIMQQHGYSRREPEVETFEPIGEAATRAVDRLR